ncbi:MAG: glycosyltransferase family 4 protein [Candidatus Dormibacteraeota bacterium]|nr:glycosyltransferase family 4 protein [Candidatus Dormibacteraeota bacterium]
MTGGVESVLGDQARRLAAAGYDVRIIAGRGEGQIVPEVDSAHPRVRRIFRELVAGRGADAEFRELSLTIGSRLQPLLADRDCIIVHNVLTMPFNLPLTAALLDSGRQLVAWVHDVVVRDDDDSPVESVNYPFRLVNRRQPGVTYVAISETRRDDLRRLWREPEAEAAVVPNGIDSQRFAGLSRKLMGLLSMIPVERAWPLILIPQRVTENKRIELALAAAAQLRERLPGLTMLVTGPSDPHSQRGELLSQLLRRRHELGLDGTVHFLAEQAVSGRPHPVNADDVAMLYRLSDVVLLTGRAEGFGLPLLEAALARVPVVCAALPVFQEISGGEIYPFPVSGEPSSIAQSVLKALDTVVARARRLALQRYSWPVVMERLEAVIAGAVAPQSVPIAP